MISIYSYPYLVDFFFSKYDERWKDNGFISIKDLPNKIIDQDILSLMEETKQELKKESPRTVWKKMDSHRKIVSNKIKVEDKNLNFPIKSYVGNYNVDICYIFATKYGSIPHRNSQLWHHDSVGRRLKMFFVLEDDPYPSLNIEKNSGVNRFFNPILNKSQRENHNPKNNIQKIKMFKENAYLIDTNFMHHGSKHIKDFIRVAFVVEISNKLKNFSRGKIGIRKEV